MDFINFDTLGEARQEQTQRNHHYRKTLCEIILLCTNQEIALRGHRENVTSVNKGNFIAILNLVASHDEVVYSQLSPKMLFILHQSSDYILCMTGMVCKGITLAVQNARVFSILANESKDISKLVIVLQYVDKATCKYMTLQQNL